MSKNLLLAMGLSAIDGLLCAFVAILAIAFLLPSQSSSPKRDAKATTVIVLFNKSASTKMSFLMSVEVTGMKVPGTKNAIHGSALSNQLTSVSRTGLTWDGPGAAVRAQWNDCSSAATVCESRLTMSEVPLDSTWSIVVRGIDSLGGLRDEYDSKIAVRASALQLPGGSSKPTDSVGLNLGSTNGARFLLQVKRDGAIEISVDKS